jgi:hypothetical protein
VGAKIDSGARVANQSAAASALFDTTPFIFIIHPVTACNMTFEFIVRLTDCFTGLSTIFAICGQ